MFTTKRENWERKTQPKKSLLKVEQFLSYKRYARVRTHAWITKHCILLTTCTHIESYDFRFGIRWQMGKTLNMKIHLIQPRTELINWKYLVIDCFISRKVSTNGNFKHLDVCAVFGSALLFNIFMINIWNWIYMC